MKAWIFKQKRAILCLSVATLMSGCQSTQDKHTEKNSTTTHVVTAPTAVQTPYQLKILHINDHHSHLDEDQVQLKFDLGQGNEEFWVKRGGFARVTALMQVLDQPEQTIKMHGGDATTGDSYYTLTDGVSDAVAMNQICFDTFVFGNHEFDAKDQGLKFFIDQLTQQQLGKCQKPTQILAANVVFGPTSPLYQNQQVKKSTIIEKQGEKIGIIGITIAKKTKNAAQTNADTLLTDELTAAQQEIDALKAQGVNKIILQSHIGYDFDQKIAQQLTDVDVIVGADSHTFLGPQSLNTVGLKPQGEYPTRTTNKNGDPVCIVQAWQYTYVLGELNVQFDPEGRIINCQGTPHLLLDEHIKHANTGKEISVEELEKIEHIIQKNDLPLRFVTPDFNTQKAIQPFKNRKEILENTVVATAKTPFCSQNKPSKTPKESCVTYGGDIQQYVAEAIYQQAQHYFKADLSLQNAGGVRMAIPQGPITQDTIYQLMPFKNKLVQLSMTGVEIKATLEDAIDGSAASAGGYPYAGAMRWVVDLTQPKGQRVQQLEVRASSGKYQPIRLNKTYQVATSDFLAHGYWYYNTLKTVTGSRYREFNVDYTQVFLDYLNALPTVKGEKVIQRLPISAYSTQSLIDAP